MCIRDRYTCLSSRPSLFNRGFNLCIVSFTSFIVSKTFTPTSLTKFIAITSLPNDRMYATGSLIPYLTSATSSKKIFDENKELVLNLDDFASMQFGWLPKSDSVSQVSNELGFGSDFMVYLDDSLFEIAQVLSAHPYMDAVIAGPDSQSTITRLANYRFFNAVSLSSDDLERGSRALKLKEQREFKTAFSKIEDFLKAIKIRLSFSKLNSEYISSDKTIMLFFFAIIANVSRLLCEVPDGLLGEFKINNFPT